MRPHPFSTVKCLPGGSSLSLTVDNKEHAFAFDRIFGPEAGQGEVFAGVSELVQSALDGYHVCLFSYGQTGAGKTYTMQGAVGDAHRGIIPRAVEQVSRYRSVCGIQHLLHQDTYHQCQQFCHPPLVLLVLQTKAT